MALFIDGRRHLLHARLHDLYSRLDQSLFLRVHRSHIVNLSFVTALEPRDGSRLTAVLASGARVSSSRSGSIEIRAMVARTARGR